MNTLLGIGLANAVLASLLALVVAVVSRLYRRPALLHSLWLLVLIKLITPPFLPLSFTWLRTPEPSAAVNPASLADAPLPAIPVPPPAPSVAVYQTPLAPLPPVERADIGNAMEAVALQPAPEGDVREGMSEPASAPSAPAIKAQPASTRTDTLGTIADPVPVVPTTVTVSATSAWSINGPALLGGVWLAGAAAYFLLAGLRVSQMRRLLRFAVPAPPQLQDRAAALARRLGLRRCPRVWLLPCPLPPLVWGLGSRTGIFFPEQLLERLDDVGCDALLVHELAHVCRRDHWVRWLEVLALGLYWWLPPCRWVRTRLQAAEEECCDAWVVGELPTAARTYATALLDTVDFLAETRPASPPLPLASGFGRVHDLKRRLQMFVSADTPRKLTLSARLVVLGLALLLLPLLPTLARPPRPQPAASEAKPSPPKPDASATTALPPLPARPPLPPILEDAERFEPRPMALQGEVLPAQSVAFAPSSRPGSLHLAVAYGTYNTSGAVRLWDLATGRALFSLPESHGVRFVAYSPDGRMLATASVDGRIKLWDAATGQERRTLVHMVHARGLAFAPDGRSVAAGNLAGGVKMWDVETGRELASFVGLRDLVFSVTFSKDGRTLAAASKDQTACVWQVPPVRKSLPAGVGSVRGRGKPMPPP
jgi:beta-lactamase regulating signal transducer with metallopeptidase domain